MVWLIVLVVLLAGVGAAVFGVFAARVQRPYQGYAGAEQFVEIPTGSGVNAITARLVEQGVVTDRLAFRVAVRMKRAERSLKAGEYRFDRPMSPLEVVDKLARGDVYLQQITFPEGMTLWEMADLFEARGFGSKDAFMKAASNGALIAELDARASDLEGYLFPETYLLPRRTSADALVRQMVRRFTQVFGEEERRLAAERGMTVREIVTLASLVEKETAVPDERPIVAGVYANRLRIGMGLQCDPTVIYALLREGRWDGNLTRADLRFDSPYNTYRYAGLPPGPIAAPGRAAIQAALAPADVPYFYFVSRNDGSHVFAETYKEHSRNVQEWQIQYFRDKRARERAEGGSQ
jgi:UPF0755 protein